MYFSKLICIALLVALVLEGCSTGYSTDGKAVYYTSWNESSGITKRTTILDPKKYVVLKGKYAKDSVHVYWSWILIEHADPASFVVLKYGEYAKDRNKIYFRGEEVKGADAATFEVTDEVDAKDKNGQYNGENGYLPR